MMNIAPEAGIPLLSVQGQVLNRWLGVSALFMTRRSGLLGSHDPMLWFSYWSGWTIVNGLSV